MKINNKVLSIPPYISTSWKNINSLLVDQTGQLIILLHSNARIIIPNLEKSIINVIFDAHAKYIELEEKQKQGLENSIGLPIKIGAEGIESFGSALQHNPAQSNAPDLPADLISKISSIIKVMEIEDKEMLPKPEPKCNCIHCQIARAVRGLKKEEDEEEIISEDDLKFRNWDIKQVGEKLYTVINPLDQKEEYNVFLGEPLGCTCGSKNCEHIRAVLNS
jgi:hypothetical protein